VGAVLYVEADGVHDGSRAADGGRARCVVVYVGSDRLDTGRVGARRQRPRGYANGKIGITQMADDAADEKTRAAKDC
jgi:hypothetical protein